MKKFSIIFVMLVSLFAFASSTYAEDATTPSKEVKFKTTAKDNKAKDRIETITLMLKGVKESNMNLEEKVLTIKYNPDEVSDEMLQLAINTLGYSAEVIKKEEEKNTDKASKEKTNLN